MTKEKLLQITDKGWLIFTHYIPELKNIGPGKKLRAIFRDDDRNPSANVYYSSSKSIYYYKDFGTDETLNPFDFVMKIENCQFKEAIKIIESKIIMTPPNIEISKDKKNSFEVNLGGNYNYWYDYAPEKDFNDTAQRYYFMSLKSFNIKKGKKDNIFKEGVGDPIFAFRIDSTELYAWNQR